MAEKSRVRFNPVTKEIEVEGSESFVKTTLDRLLAIISGSVKGKVKVKRATKAVKAAPVKADKKKPKAIKTRPPKKAKKVSKKKPGVKRVTHIDTIVGFIQGSTEGVSTAVLKEKTGLSERQIWSIVNRAAKEGKIKKAKRGVYVGV